MRPRWFKPPDFHIHWLYCARISYVMAAAIACSLAHPQVAAAVGYNIDFGTAVYGVPSIDYGAYANQPGAWNAITSTGTTTLVDLTGTATGAALNLSSSANTGGNVGPLPNLNAGDRALIGDNFYTIQSSWSVTLSGLANGLYNLFVYSPANGIVPTSSYLVNGIQQASLHGNSGGTISPLQLGLNYAIVSVLVSTGSIVISSGLDNGIFSGLAGLQLESVTATPIPAALPLFAGGLLVVGAAARRRSRKAAA